MAPTAWLEKERLMGERLAADAAPVPVRLTLSGLPVRLAVTVTAAVRVPVTVGWKVTLIVQLAPAATLDPQLLVEEKSPALGPVTWMLERDKVALPAFVNVAVSVVLMVPTA